MSIIGHIHFPHFSHGDPWHRHEINKNIRGGPEYRHGGFGSMNSTELRIVCVVLAVFTVGALSVIAR
jgi:hypothetical protein